MAQQMLSTRQAAQALGVTYKQVLDLIGRGTLPALWGGTGRRQGWRVPRTAITARQRLHAQGKRGKAVAV